MISRAFACLLLVCVATAGPATAAMRRHGCHYDTMRHTRVCYAGRYGNGLHNPTAQVMRPHPVGNGLHNPTVSATVQPK